jgi:hypothetical protein
METGVCLNHRVLHKILCVSVMTAHTQRPAVQPVVQRHDIPFEPSSKFGFLRPFVAVRQVMLSATIEREGCYETFRAACGLNANRSDDAMALGRVGQQACPIDRRGSARRIGDCVVGGRSISRGFAGDDIHGFTIALRASNVVTAAAYPPLRVAPIRR